MNLEKIGLFITTSRKEKNLTQEQLAEKLGINNRTISRWENGRNMPDVALYKSLCEILDISIEELVNGEKTNRDNIKESVEKAIINTVNLNEKTKNKMKKQVKMLITIIMLIIVFIMSILIYYNKKYPKIKINNIDILTSGNNALNEENTLDMGGFKIWFFGIDSLQLIDKENNHFDLKNALNYNQIKFEDLNEYLSLQANSNNIEQYTLFDGGTKIYKAQKYEVIFCNTLDGNRDVYIGIPNIEKNLNGAYCGKKENKTCYFIRTYYIKNISESDDNESVNVTLESFDGVKDIVKVNNTYDIKVGKMYEFKFSTEEKFNDRIHNIFENSTLISVEESNKDLNNQVNENICVN